MDIWETSETSDRPFSKVLLQIIFFGAPHNGLNTDALSTLVGGQPSAPLIQDLTPGSGVLVNLNDKFAEKLARVGRDVKILSVVETRKTKTVTQVRNRHFHSCPVSKQIRLHLAYSPFCLPRAECQLTSANNTASRRLLGPRRAGNLHGAQIQRRVGLRQGNGARIRRGPFAHREVV